MNDGDKPAFVKVMMDLSEAFRGGETTSARIDVYWRSLKDLSIGSFQYAAEQLLKREPESFWPTPGRIRKEALDYYPPSKPLDASVKQLAAAQPLPMEESARRMSDLAHALRAKLRGAELPLEEPNL